MNKKNILLISLIIVAIASLYYYNHKKEPPRPVIKHDEIIKEITTKLPEIDYQEEIKKIKNQYNNNDVVGVLTIENTNFYEIVMQSTDNDYYLEHNVYHKENWRGQTFLDYRVNINNDKKLIIYGHNSPKYTLTFKIFENYYDKNYIKDHKYLYLQTDITKKVYEIFSVYVEKEDWTYYNKMNFKDDEEYFKHIQELKENSFYDTGVNIDKDDEILIIQTCSTHKDYEKYENKFLLVIAKRIQEFDK